MWPLARAALRQHRAGFAGVLVAVLFASMLLTALGVLLESGLRGGVPAQRFVGTDVVVSASQSARVSEDLSVPFPERAVLPAEVLDRVAAVPGVASVVGDVTVPLTLPDHTRVDGHGWASTALTPYVLTAGSPPAGPDEVALDTSLGFGVGESVVLAHGAAPTTYTVVGTVEPGRGDTTGPGPGDVRSGRPTAAFFTDERAAALWPHPGAYAAVGALAESGTQPPGLASAIRAAVPDVDTYTGGRRGDAEFIDAVGARTLLVALSGSLAGTVALVAVFVVASTLSLTVRQRRREFALLRAVGATPRQIRAMVRREVLLVAGVAALIGVAPGYLLAAAFGTQLARAGISADFALAYGPLPAVAAVALSLGTAVAAAALAARKPSRTAPVDALREAAVEQPELARGRVIAGVVLLAFGALASLTPVLLAGTIGLAFGAGAVLFLVIGVALLGPLLVARALRLIGPYLRRGSAPLVLADANARGYTRRLSASIVTLALAIAVGSVQLFVASTIESEAAHQSRAGVTADLIALAPTSGIGPEAADAVAAIDGVTTVNRVARSGVLLDVGILGEVEMEVHPAQGIEPGAMPGTLDLDVRSGSLDDLAGTDTVALSNTAAAATGTGVGQTLTMLLGDGTPTEARVVAIYRRGLGFGDVTLAHDALRAHTTTGLTDLMLIAVEPTARADQIARDVAALGLVAQDRQTLDAVGAEQRSTETWLSILALGAVIGYLALAVVNTLVMVTLERRREFALLALLGSTTRQIRRMTRTEGLLIAGIAAVVGTVIAAPPLIGVAIGVSGQPLPSVPPLIYLALVGGTAVLGIGSIVLSTRAATRKE